MLHRFKIFSAPVTIAHGSIRLPTRSLASSQDCSLAISVLNILNVRPEKIVVKINDTNLPKLVWISQCKQANYSEFW